MTYPSIKPMIHCNAETAALAGKQDDPVRKTQEADISVACHNEHGIPCALDHRHEDKRISAVSFRQSS